MSEGDHGSGQGGNEPLRYFVPGELIVEVKYSGVFDPGVFADNPVFFLQGDEEADRLYRDLKEQGLKEDELTIVNNAQREAFDILKKEDDGPNWVHDAFVELEPFVRGEASSFMRLRIKELAIKGSNNEPNANETLIYLAGELELRAKSREYPPQGEQTIEGVSLNWLWSSAPDNGTTGGPGSLPVRPDPDPPNYNQEFKFDTWVTHFKPAILKEPQSEPAKGARKKLEEKLPKRESPCQVEVIILDTIPPEQVLDEWKDPREPKHRNKYLERLISYLQNPKPGSLHYYKDLSWLDFVFTWPDADHPYGIKGYLPEDPQEPIRYNMSDHGLFIASIIHRIAPDAKIHMIEVLNKHGAGSTQALIWGLDQIYKCCKQKDAQLIINSSLTIGFSPAAAEAWRIEEGRRQLHPVERFLSLLERLARSSTFSLSSSVEHKYKEVTDYFCNATSVAAAGNDNTAAEEQSLEADRAKARFPAAYGNVIGVGALTQEGEIARYSNVPDLPAPEGFYAFGGDVNEAGQKLGGKWISSNNKGILGLYTYEKYQGEPEAENTSGWARWAGTSFATAVVTGIMAQVYECENGSNSPLVRFLQEVAEEKCDDKGQVLPVGQGDRGRDPHKGKNTPNAPTGP